MSKNFEHLRSHYSDLMIEDENSSQEESLVLQKVKGSGMDDWANFFSSSEPEVPTINLEQALLFAVLYVRHVTEETNPESYIDEMAKDPDAPKSVIEGMRNQLKHWNLLKKHMEQKAQDLFEKTDAIIHAKQFHDSLRKTPIKQILYEPISGNIPKNAIDGFLGQSISSGSLIVTDGNLGCYFFATHVQFLRYALTLYHFEEYILDLVFKWIETYDSSDSSEMYDELWENQIKKREEKTIERIKELIQ